MGVLRITGTNQARRAVKKVFPKIKDSKQLSELKREKWFKNIQKLKKEGHLMYGVALVSAGHVDRKGIVDAIQVAMKKALSMAGARGVDNVKLDGGLRAPAGFKNQTTYIRGDATHLEIALASICAKVLRDRRMVAYAKTYPLHGLETNKGYGTPFHIRAIKKYGLSKLHRKTFCTRMIDK